MSASDRNKRKIFVQSAAVVIEGLGDVLLKSVIEPEHVGQKIASSRYCVLAKLHHSYLKALQQQGLVRPNGQNLELVDEDGAIEALKKLLQKSPLQKVYTAQEFDLINQQLSDHPESCIISLIKVTLSFASQIYKNLPPLSEMGRAYEYLLDIAAKAKASVPEHEGAVIDAMSMGSLEPEKVAQAMCSSEALRKFSMQDYEKPFQDDGVQIDGITAGQNALEEIIRELGITDNKHFIKWLANFYLDAKHEHLNPGPDAGMTEEELEAGHDAFRSQMEAGEVEDVDRELNDEEMSAVCWNAAKIACSQSLPDAAVATNHNKAILLQRMAESLSESLKAILTSLGRPPKFDGVSREE